MSWPKRSLGKEIMQRKGNYGYLHCSPIELYAGTTTAEDERQQHPTTDRIDQTIDDLLPFRDCRTLTCFMARILCGSYQSREEGDSCYRR